MSVVPFHAEFSDNTQALKRVVDSSIQAPQNKNLNRVLLRFLQNQTQSLFKIIFILVGPVDDVGPIAFVLVQSGIGHRIEISHH